MKDVGVTTKLKRKEKEKEKEWNEVENRRIFGKCGSVLKEKVVFV